MTLGQMLHKIFQATLISHQKAALTGGALKDAIKEEIKSTISSLDSLDRL